MIKAVIFDFDGVVVETDSFNYEVFSQLFKKNGIIFDKKIYNKYFIGKKLVECIPTYLKIFGREKEAESLINEKKKIFDALYTEKVTVFEDALNLIKRLSGKIPLAVATGTRKNLLDMAFKKFGLSNHFLCVVTAEDCSKGKPHPEPYLLASKRMLINPSETVVIEDSPSGVDAAISAGAYCVAVTHTHKKGSLKKAHKIISSLDNFDIDEIK